MNSGTFLIFAVLTTLNKVFMKSIIFKIWRQHTGESPETYQLCLMLLAVTASFLFIHQTNCYANNKSRIRIYDCGNPNSSWDTETRGESELLQGTIPAKFGF